MNEIVNTPWGKATDEQRVARGVRKVDTATHGGLRMDLVRWASLPVEVRETFHNGQWAEEDVEEWIVRGLLQLPIDWAHDTKEHALEMCAKFPRYAPARPYLLYSNPSHQTIYIDSGSKLVYCCPKGMGVPSPGCGILMPMDIMRRMPSDHLAEPDIYRAMIYVPNFTDLATALAVASVGGGQYD